MLFTINYVFYRLSPAQGNTARRNSRNIYYGGIYRRVQQQSNRIYCTFNISFYDACIECCGKDDGICANGELGIPWVTCAAPASIPFGSTVHIEGLGDFIVTDRGGAIVQEGNEYFIDIYVNTHEEALQYGRQYKEGYIELEDYYGY